MAIEASKKEANNKQLNSSQKSVFNCIIAFILIVLSVRV
ncbi:unnamed protein product [Trichobilharzia regenti]|nr:unnamed protein product [Trichobilharzia regenti]